MLMSQLGNQPFFRHILNFLAGNKSSYILYIEDPVMLTS